MQRGSEKLYQEINKCKKITKKYDKKFFLNISDRIEKKKEMEVDGREPASETSETTETSETIETRETAIETSETTEEVTDEIEAEQTQRQEHFETE